MRGLFLADTQGMIKQNTYRLHGSLPFECLGWFGSDPSKMMHEYARDQVAFISRSSGCDQPMAAAIWAIAMSREPTRLYDDVAPGRVVQITARLPQRLQDAVARAPVYAVCLEPVNSGRPFRASWVAPMHHRRALPAHWFQVELYPKEIMAMA